MAKTSRTKLAKAFVELLDRHAPEQLVPVLAAELVRQRLTGDMDLLLRDIEAELFARSGRLEVEVMSAHDLTDKIRDELSAVLKHVTGATSVHLNEQHDESVVGGLLARANELEVNMTIDDKLRRLAA